MRDNRGCSPGAAAGATEKQRSKCETSNPEGGKILFCQLMDKHQQPREEDMDLHFPLLCVRSRIFPFVQDAGHLYLDREELDPHSWLRSLWGEISRKRKPSLSETRGFLSYFPCKAELMQCGAPGTVCN